MKLWEGRFKKEPNKLLDEFNACIYQGERMYKADIKGSIAHVTMLAKVGILTDEEGKMIADELIKIQNDIESGVLEIDPDAEDIHTFIEGELTERIGVVGKKMHTARSRNDQIALDTRICLSEDIDEILDLIDALIATLCNKAEKHLNTVMPGYTHLQRAQPITFAHHLMAYTEMFLRDKARLSDCKKRVLTSPLGNCALAGTTFPLDRKYSCELLGFNDITYNSLDGVSDRDFIVEAISDLSIVMMHLSRFCEEIILWCSWEFKFIELDDAFSTGSSIMPQKKNPDIAELIRGKTGRVYGDLITILTVMKGISLAYNKDMQEDKDCLFEAIDTVKACLECFIPMLDTAKIITENMKKAGEKGFINATDCADYLVSKGLAFRDAYKITGQLVALCVDKNITLDELKIEEYKELCDAFDADVYETISLETCVKKRNVIGGPAPEIVEQHIAKVRSELE